MTTAMATKTAKKEQVYISKKKFAQQYAFMYISQPSLHDCDMKLSNFMCLLFGVGEQNTKEFLCLFLNFDTVLSDSTPEKHLAN